MVTLYVQVSAVSGRENEVSGGALKEAHHTWEEEVDGVEALCVAHADALGVEPADEVQAKVLHPTLPVR